MVSHWRKDSNKIVHVILFKVYKKSSGMKRICIIVNCRRFIEKTRPHAQSIEQNGTVIHQRDLSVMASLTGKASWKGKPREVRSEIKGGNKSVAIKENVQIFSWNCFVFLVVWEGTYSLEFFSRYGSAWERNWRPIDQQYNFTTQRRIRCTNLLDHLQYLVSKLIYVELWI